MTRAELIHALEQFPPDLDVLVDDGGMLAGIQHLSLSTYGIIITVLDRAWLET